MVAKFAEFGKSRAQHVAIAFLSLAASACWDPQYPPYLRNNTNEAVQIVVRYRSSAPGVSGELPPFSNVGHSEKGQELAQIEVRFPRGAVMTLELDQILDARRKLGPDDIEAWVIEPHAIRLVSTNEWKAIRGKKGPAK